MVYFLSITCVFLLAVLIAQYLWGSKTRNELKHNHDLHISTQQQWLQKDKEHTEHLRAMAHQMEHRLLEQEGRLRAEFINKGAAIRKDAIEKSKVVNKGFDGETFAPFLQDQWLCKDFRHISDPVDYLVLDGAEMVRSGLQEEITSVTILEIKTGNADMNTVQRRIRDAIVAAKVQFAVYNVETKEIRIWSPQNPKGKINVNNNTSTQQD